MKVHRFRNGLVIFLVCLLCSFFPNLFVLSSPLIVGEASTLLVGGGSAASPREFPWQVSLRSPLENFHFCGGVIIDHKTIITTGSCAEQVEPYMTTVVAGSVNLSCQNTPSPTRQQTVQITSTHIHPNYAETSDNSNDIAVLKVNPGFSLTEYVAPIDLYKSQDTSHLYSGTISGWGSKLESEITLQETLQKSEVKLIHSNEQCQDIIEDDQVRRLIEPSMICITSPVDGRNIDSCTGDQGGPLVVHTSGSEQPYLFGLISFGNGCGRPNMPSFCTRIFPYIEFIGLYQES